MVLERNIVMNSRLISLATAAAMALAASTAPAFAQGWNRGGGGWHGGGGGWHHHGGGGIGTGAAVALGLGAFFLGSALASAPYYNNYYSNSYPYYNNSYSNSYPYNYSYGYGYQYNYGSPGYGYYGYSVYAYAPR